MAQAYRDQNSIPTLIAASNVDGFTPIRVYADPVTHRLLVDVSASSTPGIDTVLAVGQALTADRTITNGSFKLNVGNTSMYEYLSIPTVGGTGVAGFAIQSSENTGGKLTLGPTTNSFTFPNSGNPILNLGPGSSAPVVLRFLELGSNGSNYVSFTAAASIASNVNWTLPSADSTGTQALVSNGSGTLSWSSDIPRTLVTVNAPGATPTTTVATTKIANFTGLATAITSMTTNLNSTGAVDGQLLEFRFTDNGTPRAITWGASFGSTTIALPTTTVASTMLRVGFEYNGSIWQCIAVA